MKQASIASAPLALLTTVLLLPILLFTAPAHAQTTRVVAVDGKGSATDCNAHTPAFSTSIQAALTAAAPGDTVFVCPGIYDEQVTVAKDGITLRGVGAGSTVIRPSAVAATTTSLVLGVPVRPIVLLQGANITLRSLTIDGSLADSGSSLLPDCRVLGFYLGVYVRGGSATVAFTQVTHVASATVCGHGIRAEQAVATVANNLVERYSDNGISCVGAGAFCSITGNTVRGIGPVNNQIQTGIQVRTMAGATVAGNTISDHFRIGANGVAEWSVGIFLVYADPSSNPHLQRDNVFVNNQFNVQRIATAAAF